MILGHIRRLVTLYLIGLLSLGFTFCKPPRIETRKQTVHICPHPPGADVWVNTGSGMKFVGTGPIDVGLEYYFQSQEFNPMWWLVPGIFGAATAGSGVVLGCSDSLGSFAGGLIGIGAFGALFLTSMIIIGIAKSAPKHEPELLQKEVEIGASLEGYIKHKTLVSIPLDTPEITIRLQEDTEAKEREEELKKQEFELPESSGPQPKKPVTMTLKDEYCSLTPGEIIEVDIGILKVEGEFVECISEGLKLKKTQDLYRVFTFDSIKSVSPVVER